MEKNDEEKWDMLNEHFLYEVMMLFDSLRLLLTRNLINNLFHVDIWNLLFEGVLLHARNLDDFFFYNFKKNGELKYEDDACAEQFVKSGITWELVRPNTIPLSVVDFRHRVSKQLAHLTYKRIKGNPPEKSYNYGEIAIFYLKVVQIFLNNIDEKYFGEKLKILLIQLNRLKINLIPKDKITDE